MNRKAIKIFFKILVGAGLIGWFLYRSDVEEIKSSIAMLAPALFLSAVFLNLFFMFLKSVRWKLFLPDERLVELIKLSFISQFYAVISAGQVVGEAAKIYIFGKGKRDAEQIAMSVLLDKIIGIIGLSIVALIGLALSPSVLPESLSLGVAAASLLCAIFIFSVRLALIRESLLKLLKVRLNLSAGFNKILNSAVRLIEAWHLYSGKLKIIFLSVFLSVFFQLAQVGVYFVLSRGLGFSISFPDWCWLSAVVGGLTVLPLTIGGLGLREASLVGLLGFFKIAPEPALALSFSFFTVQLIIAAVGGLLEIKRTGICQINK